MNAPVKRKMSKSKLSREAIAVIRATAGPNKEMAEAFGVSRETIWKIRSKAPGAIYRVRPAE
jgi:hypothetical protein